MNMVPFITAAIEHAEDKDKTGRAIYIAYFVNISVWQQYRAQVDTLLTIDKYTQCIVA